MGLFGFGKKDGGIMDTINADRMGDNLIWQWRPAGRELEDSNKANSLRTGSSLMVNEGQAAIFVYTENGGKQDVIIGPYNDTIKTENFPILTSIIGAAFAGGTPFPARVYFVSMEGALQADFNTAAKDGFFTVQPSQPNLSMYNLEVAVKGSLMFSCVPTEMQLNYMYQQAQQNGSQVPYEEFRDKALKDAVLRLFRQFKGVDTPLKVLQDKIADTLRAEIMSQFGELPEGVFILHVTKLIKPFSQYIYQQMYGLLRDSLAIWPTRLNITNIQFDESDDDYGRLKRVTTGTAFNISLTNEENLLNQLTTDAAVRNGMVVRQANIQMDHQEDMLGRMREEAQYAQHAQTDSTMHRTDLSSEQAYLGAHTVNVQGAVMQTGMESMGQMGNMDFGSGGGMNPAAMMMGMGMASGMAGQMGQMMGNMGNAFNNQVAQAGAPTPPPMPGQTPPAPPTPQAAAFFVLINGQQMGPCDVNAIRQMIGAGQMNAQTMVWANGMPQWAAAGTVPALAALFQVPPTPPTPGSVPPPPPTM